MIRILTAISALIFLSTAGHCQVQASLAPKTFFLKNEYGALYWEGKDNWKYNWRFKTSAKFKSIEIIVMDQEGKQKILVDDQTINHNFPLEFGFRLNDPSSSNNYNLTISFGFSGPGLMGIANWAALDGVNLKQAIYNQKIFSEDQFIKSGEFTLATYKTSDGSKEFTSTVKIKFEM